MWVLRVHKGWQRPGAPLPLHPSVHPHLALPSLGGSLLTTPLGSVHGLSVMSLSECFEQMLGNYGLSCKQWGGCQEPRTVRAIYDEQPERRRMCGDREEAVKPRGFALPYPCLGPGHVLQPGPSPWGESQVLPAR